jgi:hypothetical protein
MRGGQQAETPPRGSDELNQRCESRVVQDCRMREPQHRVEMLTAEVSGWCAPAWRLARCRVAAQARVCCFDPGLLRSTPCCSRHCPALCCRRCMR